MTKLSDRERFRLRSEFSPELLFTRSLLVIGVLAAAAYAYHRAFAHAYVQLYPYLLFAVAATTVGICLSLALLRKDRLLIEESVLEVKSFFGRRSIPLRSVERVEETVAEDGEDGRTHVLVLHLPEEEPYVLRSRNYANYFLLRKAILRRREPVRITEEQVPRKANPLLGIVGLTLGLLLLVFGAVGVLNSFGGDDGPCYTVSGTLASNVTKGKQQRREYRNVLLLREHPGFEFEISRRNLERMPGGDTWRFLRAGNPVDVLISEYDWRTKLSRNQPPSFWEKHANYPVIAVRGIGRGEDIYIGCGPERRDFDWWSLLALLLSGPILFAGVAVYLPPHLLRKRFAVQPDARERFRTRGELSNLVKYVLPLGIMLSTGAALLLAYLLYGIYHRHPFLYLIAVGLMVYAAYLLVRRLSVWRLLIEERVLTATNYLERDVEIPLVEITERISVRPGGNRGSWWELLALATPRGRVEIRESDYDNYYSELQPALEGKGREETIRVAKSYATNVWGHVLKAGGVLLALSAILFYIGSTAPPAASPYEVFEGTIATDGLKPVDYPEFDYSIELEEIPGYTLLVPRDRPWQTNNLFAVELTEGKKVSLTVDPREYADWSEDAWPYATVNNLTLGGREYEIQPLDVPFPVPPLSILLGGLGVISFLIGRVVRLAYLNTTGSLES